MGSSMQWRVNKMGYFINKLQYIFFNNRGLYPVQDTIANLCLSSVVFKSFANLLCCKKKNENYSNNKVTK